MNKTNRITQRNYSIDILKIMSMVMVITLHYLLYGLKLRELPAGTINYYSSWLLEAVCICAVNVYVLITGYYMCDKEFKFERIFKVWLKTAVIGTLIYLLLVIIRIEEISIKNMVFNMLPIITNRYWFIGCYIILMLASPIINIFINNTNKKQLAITIIGLLILNIVFDFAGSWLWSSNRGMSWIWFINLYLISAYIKKYKNDVGSKKHLLYYALFVVILFASKIILTILMQKLFSTTKLTTIFYNYNSPLCLLAAINIFIYFKNINIKSKFEKTILCLSNSTLMVYIIHENEHLRNVIFGKLIVGTDNILINLLQLLLSIVGIYGISVIINLIYEKVYLYTRNIGKIRGKK